MPKSELSIMVLHVAKFLPSEAVFIQRDIASAVIGELELAESGFDGWTVRRQQPTRQNIFKSLESRNLEYAYRQASEIKKICCTSHFTPSLLTHLFQVLSELLFVLTGFRIRPLTVSGPATYNSFLSQGQQKMQTTIPQEKR